MRWGHSVFDMPKQGNRQLRVYIIGRTLETEKGGFKRLDGGGERSAPGR